MKRRKLHLGCLFLLGLMATSAQAIEQDTDGYYQIGTAQDLVDFAAIVNAGNNNYAKGRLIADIDMTGINMDPIGKFSDNTSNKNNGVQYEGTFDGQGHVIRNITVDVSQADDKYEVGLFGRLMGATIKNLGIENGSFINSKAARGGVICGFARNGTNTITNVYAIGNLTVTSNIEASLIGGTNGGTNLTNCYTTLAKMSVQSPNLVNCYTGVTDEEMSGGELCYMLNGKRSTNCSFFQTIGEDDHPVPNSTHAVVYANGELRCDGQAVAGGAITYSNSNTSLLPPHVYINGICKNCAGNQAPVLAADGFYEIGNAGQLLAWAKIVGDQAMANQSVKTNINARLTADIDLEGIAFQPICKHIDNDARYNCYGYGGIFDGQGYEIQNLSINCDYEAGFFSRARDGEIRNLGIRNASVVTTANRAGILAGGSYSHINNCYIVGDLNVQSTGEKGAFGGQIRFYNVDNCYTTYAAFYGSLHSTSKLNNCYYGTAATDIAASGELCYKLNGNSSDACTFYQTIGQDATPVLSNQHATVYCVGSFFCDGTSKGEVQYNNVGGEGVTDPHIYANGICSVCNDNEAPVLNGSYYEISNAGQLLAWAKIVGDEAVARNSVKTNINARLTADIDLEGIDFQPICKHIDDDATYNCYGYGGIFDGQGYEIQNLSINCDYEAGFFSRARDGEIKNLGIRNASVVTTASRAGVIAGGGYTRLNNVYTCGNITVSSTSQKGGIIGECRFYGPHNCYTTYPTFYGNLHSSLTDFNVKNDLFWGDAANSILASGELAYKLGTAYRQTIGTDAEPVLKSSSEKVYYVGAAGYATLYDAEADWMLNGDATAYIGIINGDYLTLSAIAEIPAGNAVVLKGTYYNKVATTATSSVEGNDLQGSAEAVASDGTYYALAKFNDVVGFYTVADGTIIPAGKAYLHSAAGIKGFNFELIADDATGLLSAKEETEQKAYIFNLAGQRLLKAQRGINIVNGKKVLY